METAVEQFRNLPTTKEQIKSFVPMFINELENGVTNPLKVAVDFSAFEKLIKEIKDHPKYKELVRKEAENEGSGEKIFDRFGAKIELAETGTKYDYSDTNDSELFDLYEKKAELDQKIKDRETFLKSIKGEVYGSDGVQLFPPIKSSTSSIKITLK